MFIKSVISALHLKLYTFKFNPIRHSALFINGPEATGNFVYVTPYIEYEQILNHKECIQSELCRRKSSYDLDKLSNLWEIYNELKKIYTELKVKKIDVSNELRTLKKNEPSNELIQKLEIQLGLVKENLNNIKSPFWSAEHAAVIEYLKLPNRLHPQTPSINNVIYEHLKPPNHDRDHLKIGKDLEIIEFQKNNYYLKGDAALFELGAIYHFSKILKEHNFTQFSNADFVKSLVVEGCGEDYTNPNKTFILQTPNTNVDNDNRLHLVGGSSLYAFLAYHTKNVLHSKSLPIKYFTCGRQYLPVSSDKHSLYSVNQSTVVQFFGMTSNNEGITALLGNVTELMKSYYTQLNVHFRLTILSADKLSMWESFKVILEMYSTSLNTYVEIGNVSISGDFLSKRLMLTYVENKQSKFPYIISGTLLNVPRLLGCILENNDKFTLPKHFSVDKWCI